MSDSASAGGSGMRVACCSVARSLVLMALAHDDPEPALTILDDAVHLLVVRAAEVRLVDDDGPMHRLRLRPDAVDPAGPLFECARVPGKVVVDHIPAVPLQVDAFSHHRAGDQNLREERRVEGQHEAPSWWNGAPCRWRAGRSGISTSRCRAAFRRVEVLDRGCDAAGLDAGRARLGARRAPTSTFGRVSPRTTGSDRPAWRRTCRGARGRRAGRRPTAWRQVHKRTRNDGVRMKRVTTSATWPWAGVVEVRPARLRICLRKASYAAGVAAKETFGRAVERRKYATWSEASNPSAWPAAGR